VPGIAVAAALAVAAGSVGYSIAQSSQGSSQQTAVTTPSTGQTTTPFGGGSSQGSGGNGSGGTFGDPFGNGSTGSGSSGTTGSATEAQQAGVVDINTVLDYGTAKAAGTGIILSSDGEILTNNHVIDSSTSISVTVVSTGKTYTASVVGTDPTADVAVIKLQGASGLTTANLGDSSTVKVGDAVTAVGNAGGTGGTPSSPSG
jgi:S1-C subfamily serine protease